MQKLLAANAHVPLVYLAGIYVFKSSTMALCAALPYLAYELAVMNANKTNYATLSTLAGACAATFGSFVVNKPPTIFELLNVVPDIRSSLSLRIQINKLLNIRPTPPIELIQAARMLVNDADRRRYMAYGPTMEANTEETLLWYLIAFFFMCSITSRRGSGGAGTLLFGSMLLFLTCSLEMVETNSPQPAIRLDAFPLLCTFELMQGLRVVAVCIFSTVVYFTRASYVDHVEHSLQSLGRTMLINEKIITLVLHEEEVNE